MDRKSNDPLWWAQASIRISKDTLDPNEVSDALGITPEIYYFPGESKVRCNDCTSAGYWCKSHRIENPERPDKLFLWSESFVADRLDQFSAMLDDGCHIYIYIAIHSNVMTLGFNIPHTPSITKLKIPIGIEYFS